jgi:hypothetical protein
MRRGEYPREAKLLQARLELVVREERHIDRWVHKLVKAPPPNLAVVCRAQSLVHLPHGGNPTTQWSAVGVAGLRSLHERSKQLVRHMLMLVVSLGLGFVRTRIG